MPGKPRGGKRKLWKRKPRVRRARKSTVLVNRALHPIPQRFITKQKYSDTFTINPAGLTSYGFNLNSVFDPNRSGIGFQPYGFDQLATLYNRYRVIGCSWRINFTADVPIRAAAMATNEFPTFNGMSDMITRPRSKYVVQLPGGSTQTLTGYVSIPSLVGRSRSQYMSDDRYQAEVTANPQELALLWISAQTMADGSVTAAANIVLEYTVEYFDMKPLAQS